MGRQKRDMNGIDASISNTWSVLKLRSYRVVLYLAAVAYLFIYLAAIRQLVRMPFDLSASYGVPVPSLHFAADWTAKIWRPVAPLVYEPVAALYATERIMWLIAVPNVLLGLLLGALLGINVALAVYSLRCARSCGVRSGAAFLGVIPSMLSGAACCGPSFALIAGTNAALAISAVRGWLLPASLLLLVAGALWTARGIPAAQPSGRR